MTAHGTDWNAMDDAAFRQAVRAFYREHYPAHLRGVTRYLGWDEMKDWYATLYARGWAAPSWPREWGGMGLDAAKQLIFHEERTDISRGPDFNGIVMLGPVLMRFGNDAQKQHYLPRTLSCEYRWAQGYSEPGSGSDLASLRTEAVLDGDVFVVNGQKIWTTWALDCTHCFALVRTDKTVKKQAGISFLLIDLAAKGVKVRGIRNLGGNQAFCEVFFDDVRVPKENLVGGLNEGWNISRALVGFERLLIGNPKHCLAALARLTVVANAQGIFDDAAFVERWAQLRMDVEDLGATYGRFCDLVRRGETLPPDVSMLKILATETFKRITEEILAAAQDAGGTAGVVEFPAGSAELLPFFYMSRPTTIGAGTSEIQRTLMARQVLNLPV